LCKVANSYFNMDSLAVGRIIVCVFRDKLVFGIITRQLSAKKFHYTDGLHRVFTSPSSFTTFHAHELHPDISRTRSNFNGKEHIFQSLDDLKSGVVYNILTAVPPDDGKSKKKSIPPFTIPKAVLDNFKPHIEKFKQLVKLEELYPTPKHQLYNSHQSEALRDNENSYDPHSELIGVYTLSSKKYRSKLAPKPTPKPNSKRKRPLQNGTSTQKKRRLVDDVTIETAARALHHDRDDIQLLGVIKATNYARIHRCRFKHRKEECILKEYLHNGKNIRGRRRAFKNEVNLMFKHCISNPRLVNFKGYIYDNESEFWGIITTRYDMSLGEFIGVRRSHQTMPFTEKLAIRIAFHVADALKFLHSAAIPVYHKDIKPANILLLKTSSPRQIEAFLCDLGISCEVEDVAAMNSSEGTCIYMAPELLDHTASAHIRGDIYALAAVFYEMLTGERPWRGCTNSTRILGLMKAGTLPGDANLISNPELKQLILRCWHLNPENRPTAAEFIETLMSCMDSEEIDRNNYEAILTFLKNRYDTSLTLQHVRGSIQNMTLQERKTFQKLMEDAPKLLKEKFTRKQRQLLRDAVVSQRHIMGINCVEELQHKDLAYEWVPNVIYLLYQISEGKGYVGQTFEYWKSRVSEHFEAMRRYIRKQKAFIKKVEAILEKRNQGEQITENPKPPTKPPLIDQVIARCGSGAKDWKAIPICTFNSRLEANEIEVLLILLLNTCYSEGVGMGYNISSGGSWDSTKCIEALTVVTNQVESDSLRV